MNKSPDESERETLENYIDNPAASNRHVEETGDEWRCAVCGFETDESHQVAACHPRDRLDEERQAAISTPNESQTGFRYPSRLFDEIRVFFKSVEQAVEQADPDVSPLQAATEVIRSRLTSEFPASQAFQLYTYLVFCQQHHLLPGYPQYTNTDTETVSIKEFCTNHPGFDGTVTDELIQTSELVRAERMYRATVRTTTTEFLAFENSFPFSGHTLWEDQTVLGTRKPVDAMGIFGEGTAHNTVAIEARDWLASHPQIDWAVAPHTMGCMAAYAARRQHRPKFSTDESTESEPTHPVAVFDAAGFSDQDPPRLTALCTVVTEDQHLRTIYELGVASRSNPDAYAIAIMPDRKSIEDLIVNADETGVLPDDPSPDRGVREHYSRLPSISAINDELTRHVYDPPWLKFLTWKQLIDDIVEPDEVISLPKPKADA